MKNVPYRKTVRLLSGLLALFILVWVCCIAVLIASATVDGSARTLPSYGQEDISALLARAPESWTEEELEKLGKQTGILSHGALLKEVKEKGTDVLLAYQSALFYEGDLRHETIVPNFTYHDYLVEKGTDTPYKAFMVELEPGDVLLTSSTHSVGWRHGHAVLILSDGYLLQSVSLGTPSQIVPLENAYAGIPWFSRAANFIVLRLKGADEGTRLKIADLAERTLADVPYSLTVGVFSKKDQGTDPRETQCAHLVWQAFKNFGYDVDADGGAIVTPLDLARSPLFETVQIYGFDPIKGW